MHVVDKTPMTAVKLSSEFWTNPGKKRLHGEAPPDASGKEDWDCHKNAIRILPLSCSPFILNIENPVPVLTNWYYPFFKTDVSRELASLVGVDILLLLGIDARSCTPAFASLSYSRSDFGVGSGVADL